VFERGRRAHAFGGGFRVALGAPPYRRRRATLQPPQKQKTNGLRQETSPDNGRLPLTAETDCVGGVVPFCSAAVVNFHSALDRIFGRCAKREFANWNSIAARVS
jgi:hypothetical protein